MKSKLAILKSISIMVLISSCIFIVKATEKIDYQVIVKIRTEGLKHSQVMKVAQYLTDLYGPRVAHSPSYNEALHWAVKKFKSWGIEKVAIEPWGKIGLGWENQFTSVHMISPRYMPIIAYPLAWTAGTKGRIKASTVYVNTNELYTPNDLNQYRGRLKGKIILLKPKRKLKLNFKPDAVRLSQEELEDMASLQIIKSPEMISVPRETMDKLLSGESKLKKRILSEEKIEEFFRREGAVVLVEPGMGADTMDKGTVRVNDRQPITPDDPIPLPHLVMAAEHYNRLMRLMEMGYEVKMDVEIRNEFYNDDLKDYNLIAELPGSDLQDEIVMIGAHLDAKSAGTGATDNAAGSAVVMEAMRILKAIDAKPRRTIRAALWGAEECGHLGSLGYVGQHFYDWQKKIKLPEYDKFYVYFNVDWYGRFRGIYLQGNDLARPIFEAWMKPFHDLGMTYLVPGNTGGTDHMSFLKCGLPGFQFIQDDLEFFTKTFHTNMDVYDRLVPEDLMQAATILAAFAYNAATREGKFPPPTPIDNGRRWHK